MKKFFFAFLLTSIYALNSTAAPQASISGIWDRGKDSEIRLYQIIAGRIEILSTYNLQNNKKFGFAFEPSQEGFYVIGSGVSTSSQNKYIFYFKPGDKLNVAVNDSTYTLVGENTPENKAMGKWHDAALLLELRSVYFNSKYGRPSGDLASTYVDFFPILESKAKEIQNYASKTGNAAFDKKFNQFRYYDLLRYAATFVMTPRSAHPEKDDFGDFYHSINLAQITQNSDILSYPFGMNMLPQLEYVQAKVQGTPFSKSLDDSFKNITDNTIRGEYVVNTINRVRVYDDYVNLEKQYKQYITTEDQKERLNTKLTQIAQEKPISETIDFSGFDLNGKKVSLSDFKGKVVVIDAWATWCGPCKKEIPYLKEVEKAYHGKDVVFMSIALDEAKDKQKWIDFVKKEELPGVQLFGGNGMKSDVAKFYKINAIPRFMLFGKKGNIVTEDAPRPSHPDLKKMIDVELKK